RLRYTLQASLLFAFLVPASLVLAKVRQDDTEVGCQGRPYKEAGREESYNMFMDKPADDLREHDAAKRTRRNEIKEETRERKKESRREEKLRKKEERRRAREEKPEIEEK